jgi:hypothetical protein
VALTATASYLTVHHAGPLAPAIAAVHGYDVAFTVSAVLFGVGALVAILLLPSRRRIHALQNPLQPATATPAASPALTDRLPADGAVQSAELR